MSASVSIVFLVHNRCEKLRVSLAKMLGESDYPAERVEVIVIDNASTDGSAAMVRDEFPGVRVIERAENTGVSAWNDGFEVASGEFVLALDDDCYLPPDGLRRAVEAATEQEADLVSFAVRAEEDPEYLFTEEYPTGLLSFWGCAVLMRRSVIERLGGYDREIFVWANELEFTIRFFDAGFRHLHLPEVVAVHMKPLGGEWIDFLYCYCVNAQHFGYIAAKLLRPKDALDALMAVVALSIRDARKIDRPAIKAIPYALRGFRRGLAVRTPVRNREISRIYRRNQFSFASPWWYFRPPRRVITDLPHKLAVSVLPDVFDGRPPMDQRRDEYFTRRGRFYPEAAATLDLRGGRG